LKDGIDLTGKEASRNMKRKNLDQPNENESIRKFRLLMKRDMKKERVRSDSNNAIAREELERLRRNSRTATGYAIKTRQI